MSVYYTFVSFFLFLKNKIFFICFLLGFVGFLCVCCKVVFFFFFFFMVVVFWVFFGGSRVS